MKNINIQLKGGESIEYNSSGLIEFDIEERTIEMKFRNDDTNGKFVTQIEYNKLIRRRKLNKINEKIIR